MNPLPPGIPTAPIRLDISKRPEHIRKSQQALIDTYNWECCLNCEHFTKTSQKSIPDETSYSGQKVVQTGPLCMKYGMLPPLEVIVIGCVDFNAGIPF